MLVCKNCSKQLEEGAKFCKFCGSKIDNIDKVIDVGSSVAEVSEVSTNTNVSKGGKEKLIFTIIPVLLIMIAAFAIIPKLFSSSDVNDMIFYIKDNEINYTNLKKNEPIELTEGLYNEGNMDEYMVDELFYYNIHMSKDGKYIIYPDNFTDYSYYTLYYSNIKDKNAEKVKIDSDINYYALNDDKTNVFYVKGSNGNLYKHDLKDKTKIGSEISNFHINSDGTKIVYVNYDGEIYIQNEGADKEKIDSNSYIVNVSDDLSKIYYMKENTLYRKDEGKDKVKVDSDVSYVVMSNDSDEVYYVKSDEIEKKLADFVVDDFKDSDALIYDPSIVPSVSPETPDFDDYNTFDEYFDALDKYYVEYQKYQDDYNMKYDLFRDKDRRDDLRESLESETINHYYETLYYYNGKESVVLTDTYAWSSYVVPHKGAMIYYQFKKPEFKTINLSEVLSLYDVYNIAEESLSQETQSCVAINGTNTLIEDVQSSYFGFNQSLSALYYIDNEDSDVGDLYELKISGKSLGKPVKYDDDVYSFAFLDDGETLVYFKDKDDNGNCDLYVDKLKVDSDVSWVSLNNIPSTNSFTYYTDYSNEKQYGTLKIYENKEVKKIADDVHKNLPIMEDKIIYLTDYNLNKSEGDAYLYDGSGEKTLIDEDVVAFIIPGL